MVRTGAAAMRDGGERWDERASVKAAVAGLALLGAAALAAGVFDGRGGGAPARPDARAAAAGDGRARPVPGLCFHGPGGEPVDFPAEQNCSRAAAGVLVAHAF
jgi:hypothetical protein